jgi:hypothetical protein
MISTRQLLEHSEISIVVFVTTWNMKAKLLDEHHGSPLMLPKMDAILPHKSDSVFQCNQLSLKLSLVHTLNEVQI